MFVFLLSAAGNWSGAARELVASFLEPTLPNFEVTAVTRAPYLCQGTPRVPIFVLDDCVVVLRRRPGMPPTIVTAAPTPAAVGCGARQR